MESLKAIATMTGPKDQTESLQVHFLTPMPQQNQQVELGGVIQARGVRVLEDNKRLLVSSEDR